MRLLVERMGFRSVAWEEDWTTGLQIDQYIRTGKGDLDALVKGLPHRRRAGSSDPSAGSSSTSSPWTSTPPPRRRCGGGST
jgi:hypothetical protein